MGSPTSLWLIRDEFIYIQFNVMLRYWFCRISVSGSSGYYRLVLSMVPVLRFLRMDGKQSPPTKLIVQ